MLKVKMKSLSCGWLSAAPWTVAHQAPPSVGLSRQEYWSGLLFPSPGRIQETFPRSFRCRDWTRVSHTAGRCFTIWATREVQVGVSWLKKKNKQKNLTPTFYVGVSWVKKKKDSLCSQSTCPLLTTMRVFLNDENYSTCTIHIHLEPQNVTLFGTRTLQMWLR